MSPNCSIVYFGLLLLLTQDLYSCFFSKSRNCWAVDGNLKNVRIEEIPFSKSDLKRQEERPLLKLSKSSAEIYANRDLRRSRSFFHIFKVPCK